MNNYRRCDTTCVDGIYIKVKKLAFCDNDTSPTDFDCFAPEDIAAHHRGDWCFLGVRARACIRVVRNGVATMYDFESAGIFGIMSTDGAGIDEAYEEQKKELLADIKALSTEPHFMED